MINYRWLDDAIISSLARGPLSFNRLMEEPGVIDAASEIAESSQREAFRILDRRMQALRKKMRVRFERPDGWMLVEVNRE